MIDVPRIHPILIATVVITVNKNRVKCIVLVDTLRIGHHTYDDKTAHMFRYWNNNMRGQIITVVPSGLAIVFVIALATGCGLGHQNTCRVSAGSVQALNNIDESSLCRSHWLCARRLNRVSCGDCGERHWRIGNQCPTCAKHIDNVPACDDVDESANTNPPQSQATKEIAEKPTVIEPESQAPPVSTSSEPTPSQLTTNKTKATPLSIQPTNNAQDAPPTPRAASDTQHESVENTNEQNAISDLNATSQKIQSRVANNTLLPPVPIAQEKAEPQSTPSKNVDNANRFRPAAKSPIKASVATAEPVTSDPPVSNGATAQNGFLPSGPNPIAPQERSKSAVPQFKPNLANQNPEKSNSTPSPFIQVSAKKTVTLPPAQNSTVLPPAQNSTVTPPPQNPIETPTLIVDEKITELKTDAQETSPRVESAQPPATISAINQQLNIQESKPVVLTARPVQSTNVQPGRRSDAQNMIIAPPPVLQTSSLRTIDSDNSNELRRHADDKTLLPGTRQDVQRDPPSGSGQPMGKRQKSPSSRPLPYYLAPRKTGKSKKREPKPATTRGISTGQPSDQQADQNNTPSKRNEFESHKIVPLPIFRSVPFRKPTIPPANKKPVDDKVAVSGEPVQSPEFAQRNRVANPLLNPTLSRSAQKRERTIRLTAIPQTVENTRIPSSGNQAIIRLDRHSNRLASRPVGPDSRDRTSSIEIVSERSTRQTPSIDVDRIRSEISGTADTSIKNARGSKKTIDR